MLVLDDHHIGVGRTGTVQDAARAFLNRQVQAGDLGGGRDDHRRRQRVPGLHRGRRAGERGGGALRRTSARRDGGAAGVGRGRLDGARRGRAGHHRAAAGGGRGRRRPVGEPGGGEPGRIGVRRAQRGSDGRAPQLHRHHLGWRDHRQRRRRRRGAGAGADHPAHAAHGRRRARRHPRAAQGDPLLQRGPAGDGPRRRSGRRAEPRDRRRGARQRHHLHLRSARPRPAHGRRAARHRRVAVDATAAEAPPVRRDAAQPGRRDRRRRRHRDQRSRPRPRARRQREQPLLPDRLRAHRRGA